MAPAGYSDFRFLHIASEEAHFNSSGESIMKQLGKYLSAFFMAVMLITAVGCASTSKQEGTGEYVDDSVITTKVKAAILNEPTLKVAEINVETFKGVVQLSGFVSSQTAINKAVDLTRHVTGVKSVKNDMRIK
jgi:hyperosmotically inducible protein